MTRTDLRIVFEIPDYWTPAQALAVYELLDGLRDLIDIERTVPQPRGLAGGPLKPFVVSAGLPLREADHGRAPGRMRALLAGAAQRRSRSG